MTISNLVPRWVWIELRWCISGRHMGSGLLLGFSRQPRQIQHGLDQWGQTVHRGPTGGTVIDILRVRETRVHSCSHRAVVTTQSKELQPAVQAIFPNRFPASVLPIENSSSWATLVVRYSAPACSTQRVVQFDKLVPPIGAHPLPQLVVHGW